MKKTIRLLAFSLAALLLLAGCAAADPGTITIKGSRYTVAGYKSFTLREPWVQLSPEELSQLTDTTGLYTAALGLDQQISQEDTENYLANTLVFLNDESGEILQVSALADSESYDLAQLVGDNIMDPLAESFDYVESLEIAEILDQPGCYFYGVLVDEELERYLCQYYLFSHEEGTLLQIILTTPTEGSETLEGFITDPSGAAVS